MYVASELIAELLNLNWIQNYLRFIKGFWEASLYEQ